MFYSAPIAGPREARFSGKLRRVISRTKAPADRAGAYWTLSRAHADREFAHESAPFLRIFTD
jgi:hypothetical protein